MINQNARRTIAAGVLARALGTLGAATLLLTSTGWSALAGNTGFGAVNPNAYQSATAPGAGNAGTGDAAKAGGDDPALLAAAVLDDKALKAIALKYAEDKAYNTASKAAQNLPFVTPPPQKSDEQIKDDIIQAWADSGGDPSTTTAPAPRPGSSAASSSPTTTTTAPVNLPPLQASTDTPAEAAGWQAVSDAHDAAIAAQIALQAAQDEKTEIYFAYKYDHLTPAQSAVIGEGGYEQFMARMDKVIDFLAQKVDQAWAAYSEAQNNAAAIARAARGGPSQLPPTLSP